MTLESLPSSARRAPTPDFIGSILLGWSHGLTINRDDGELHLCIINDDVIDDCDDIIAAEKAQLHRFVFVPILHSEAMALAEGKPIDYGPVSGRVAFVSDRTFDDATAPVWSIPAKDIVAPEWLVVEPDEPTFMVAQVTQWLCSWHSHPQRGGGQCHCGMRAEEPW
jgi:hypothetical protein